MVASGALALVLASGCAFDEPPEWEPPPPAAAAAVPAPGPERVAISDFEFRPRQLVVDRGTRISWGNRDAANHDVTFKGSPGVVGNVRRGDSVSVRLRRPGRYRYLCALHPAMRGTVIVRP